MPGPSGRATARETSLKHTLRNPTRTEAVWEDIESGHTIREIVHAHGINPSTVAALRDHPLRTDPEARAAWRAQTTATTQSITSKALARLDHAIDCDDPKERIKSSQLPVTIGILIDKLAVLDASDAPIAAHPDAPTPQSVLGSLKEMLNGSKAVSINVDARSVHVHPPAGQVEPSGAPESPTAAPAADHADPADR